MKNINCEQCGREVPIPSEKASSFDCIWPDCGCLIQNPIYMNYLYCQQCGKSWTHMGDLDGAECPGCMEYWYDDKIDVLTETEYNELITTKRPV